MKKLYGGIEAGGTKFVCIVGTGPNNVVAETTIPTTDPDQTIRSVVDFFNPYKLKKQLMAVGIATFGPVDLDRFSPTYGYITTTVKPKWGQVNLLGRVKHALEVPVAFDTDVNGAVFGEYYWIPENKQLDSLVYITIGTGIGVGVLVDGRPLHGLVHVEAGHLAIPHDVEKDPFPGICSYHGDCLEGLASGPSMAQRWKLPAERLPEDHPAWDLEAEYIALGLVNLIYAYSPNKIILGGGVSQHPGFHKSVRKKVRNFINGYINSPMVLDRIDEYIVPPSLGNRSGVLGAIAMGMELVAQ